MRNLILLTVIALTVGSVNAQRSRPPSFGSYPAAVEKARAKAINFRLSPDARTFRTRLSDALRRGVNFAGHYIIAAWGCGTGCLNGAVIDARNGRVYFPNTLAGIAMGYTDDGYDEPLTFRKNSRLLILSGAPNGSAESGDKPSGTYFYEWKNNRFRLLRFIPSPSN